MSKKGMAFFFSCLLGIGLLTGCTPKTESATGKTSEQQVIKGNLEVGLGADGRISRSLSNLDFEISGTVKKVNVQIGQPVKAGDILAELDDTDLKLAVTKAENALDKAETNYSEAVNQYNINKMEAKLRVDQAKAKWDENTGDSTLKAAYELELKKYETLKNNSTQIHNAKLIVEEAKNSLQEAKNNLNKIYLKSPINGEVMNITNKVGELVTGTRSSTDARSSTSFITIMDPSVTYVKANASESDISGIEVGQQMRISVDSLSLENLPGEVVSINDTPTIDNSGIVTYEVIGKLTEDNPAIKDGMTSFITFLKKEKKDVLLVPNKAIFLVDGKQYVNVKASKDKTEKRAITGGLTNGIQTEVVDGLKQGETVIIGGAKK